MKKIVYILLLIPFLIVGQTQSENYIKSTTYKVPTSVNSNPSDEDKIVNITYFDGLGRSFQKIAHRQSASGKDIVTHIEYDEFGRMAREYLPFIPTTSASLNLKTNEVKPFYETNNVSLTGNPYFEPTAYPYSEKIHDDSPLNRVFKQAAPGDDWKNGSGHEIKMDYKLNGLNDVINFSVSNTGNLIDYGYYLPNLVYKTITKNENWQSADGDNNTSIEYKDSFGRIILKRAFNQNDKFDTYYVYDKIGNLRYVLPPMFIDTLTINTQSPSCSFIKSLDFRSILSGVNGAPIYGGGEIRVEVSNNQIKVIFNAGFTESYVNTNLTPTIENNPIVCNLPNTIIGEVILGTIPFEVSVENNKLKLERAIGAPLLNLTSFNTEITASYYTPASSVSNTPQTLLNGLCYQYKYDEYNRLIEKKLPGKQWEFIVYDKLDRIVCTGPTLSPFNGTDEGWMYTKYDDFNRVCFTGWYKETFTTTSRSSLQSNYNSSSISNASRINSIIDGVSVNYSSTNIPPLLKLLTVNYYDNYNYPASPVIPSTILAEQVATNVKGLSTGNWVRVIMNATTINYETSFNLYDSNGRVIRVNKNNHFGGYTRTDSRLDFLGKPHYTITTHRQPFNADLIITEDEYIYTDQDRLETHTQKINNGPTQLIAHNEYDELGQLIIKNVGGIDTASFVGLQKVDYRYNIRGWLTHINDPSLNHTYDNDLFDFQISYNYITDDLNGQIKPLFNGNISETRWSSNTDNITRQYSYAYDDLNRLSKALYQKPYNAISLTRSYDEEIEYDKNGNITRLLRNGDSDSDDINYTLQIDDLSYDYVQSSLNQLRKVSDATNSPQGFKDNVSVFQVDDYTYDAYGNMTSDKNKNIQNIIYNHLNLPTQIVFDTGDIIYYFYNALGQKVQKKVIVVGTNPSTTITDYIDGYQYTNGIVNFFPHPEGYVNVTYCNQCAQGQQYSYNYVFNYTDHLGNIRVSYGLDPETQVLKILEQNHYYPFGLKHTNYNSDTKIYDKEENILKISNVPAGVVVPYKYKYNGKEYQDELGLNMYDYGARNYDPAIGRWMNVDPLAEEFSEWSPYSFCYNNPLRFIDPDGQAPDDIVILGANKSSVTIKTNLINVSVNASSLGIDFGGKYTLSGGDIVQAAVDIAGVFDPTPACDILGAKLSADSGDWWGAGASVLGAALPYAGDLAKGPKIAKGLDKISDAIDTARSEKKAVGSYTVTFESGKKYHGKGTEARMNTSAKDKAKANDDPVKSKDFTKAKNDKEAFIQESKRIETDKVGNTPGHKNPNNYNKRASPGDKYRRVQDGN